MDHEGYMLEASKRADRDARALTVVVSLDEARARLRKPILPVRNVPNGPDGIDCLLSWSLDAPLA